MLAEDIAKKFRERGLKELKDKEIGWKIGYVTALEWFGSCILEKRYVSRETAKKCKGYLKRKRGKERLLKENKGFDAASKLIDDTMGSMAEKGIGNTEEIAKAILELKNGVDAEATAYAALLSGSAAS